MPVPGSEFNDLILRDGDLEVSGPFAARPVGLLGDIHIRFLIIQEPRVRGGDPVIIDERAIWKHGDGKTWKTVIPKEDLPKDLRLGKVRGIALAVAVREPAKKDVPPSFETLTWCVTTRIKRPQRARRSAQPVKRRRLTARA